MERENERRPIPAIFDEPNPIELSPGKPAYTYYVQRRTISCLEDLSHTTNNNELTEKIKVLVTDFLLLRLYTKGSEMTPSDHMTYDVFDTVLNLFEDNETITCESVLQKYREYTENFTGEGDLVRDFVEDPAVTERIIV